MRFLTPVEDRLLSSLPGDERSVLQAFFEECDARLVMGGAELVPARPSDEHAGVPAPPVTSQDALFPMHKKEARP